MGYLNNINLINFRNFNNFTLDFSKNCNVLYGENGCGKTNILEGISLLSKGRGLRKDKLKNIINKNYNQFIIKSNFEHNDIIYNVVSKTSNVNNRIKKLLSVNDDHSLESLENLYNLKSYLIFLPETERLFLSSPNTRRNFIDHITYHDTQITST